MRPVTLPSASLTEATSLPPPTLRGCWLTVAPAATSCSIALLMSSTSQYGTGAVIPWRWPLGSRPVRNPSQRAPRGPMGRLVRRTEPHPGVRRHNRDSRLCDRPGRPAWLAEQGTRFRSALDRGYAARFQIHERDRKMKITASNLTHWAG